jgi:hypothetical protein
MSEKPIIFSAPMVRAILAGNKSQTRRILKDQETWNRVGEGILRRYPQQRAGVPVCPGYRLWVRETCRPWGDDGSERLALAISTCTGPEHISFRATADEAECAINRWRPSIYMPRWASRITLAVTDVRVQRLQDISEEDAKAEGVECLKSGRGYYSAKHGKAAVHFGVYHDYAKEAFADLWNTINGDDAWEANPWVYAISFASAPRQDEEGQRPVKEAS